MAKQITLNPAEAQKIRLPDPVFVHEIIEVVRELGQGEGRGSHGGSAVATGVDGADEEIAGKVPDLMFKKGAVLTVSVQEQQGGAVTGAEGVMQNVHRIPRIISAPARS